MKHLYKKIIIGLSCFYILGLHAVTFAADVTTAETIISKPVGAGILPGSGNEGADIESSIVFTTIIPFVITWGINLAMALAVLAVIYGGYLYLTSFGDDDKKSKAINTIIYAAIGLIITITAYGIVTIVSRLQFT